MRPPRLPATEAGSAPGVSVRLDATSSLHQAREPEFIQWKPTASTQRHPLPLMEGTCHGVGHLETAKTRSLRILPEFAGLGETTTILLTGAKKTSDHVRAAQTGCEFELSLVASEIFSRQPVTGNAGNTTCHLSQSAVEEDSLQLQGLPGTKRPRTAPGP